VEQAGHAKSSFHGLPSPAAGMALATFYPFSQTTFFSTYLSHWAWPEIMTGLMIVIGMLMMSHVLYPVVPRIGFRTRGLLFNTIFLSTLVVLAVTVPSLYFFTASVTYVVYGILKSVVLGMLDRIPGEEDDPMLDGDDDDADDAGAELREISYEELSPARRFVRRSPSRRAEDHSEEDRP
jgi:CDP-diacylglycerol--serine O-phosphatidyltransferase